MKMMELLKYDYGSEDFREQIWLTQPLCLELESELEFFAMSIKLSRQKSSLSLVRVKVSTMLFRKWRKLLMLNTRNKFLDLTEWLFLFLQIKLFHDAAIYRFPGPFLVM